VFILPAASITRRFFPRTRKKEADNPGSLNLERTTNDAPRERVHVTFMVETRLALARCTDAPSIAGAIFVVRFAAIVHHRHSYSCNSFVLR